MNAVILRSAAVVAAVPTSWLVVSELSALGLLVTVPAVLLAAIVRKYPRTSALVLVTITGLAIGAGRFPVTVDHLLWTTFWFVLAGVSVLYALIDSGSMISWARLRDSTFRMRIAVVPLGVIAGVGSGVSGDLLHWTLVSIPALIAAGLALRFPRASAIAFGAIALVAIPVGLFSQGNVWVVAFGLCGWFSYLGQHPARRRIGLGIRSGTMRLSVVILGVITSMVTFMYFFFENFCYIECGDWEVRPMAPGSVSPQELSSAGSDTGFMISLIGLVGSSIAVKFPRAATVLLAVAAITAIGGGIMIQYLPLLFSGLPFGVYSVLSGSATHFDRGSPRNNVLTRPRIPRPGL